MEGIVTLRCTLTEASLYIPQYMVMRGYFAFPVIRSVEYFCSMEDDLVFSYLCHHRGMTMIKGGKVDW